MKKGDHGNNTINVSYHITSLLSRLYGQQMSYELGYNLKDLKKEMRKLIMSLEYSIDLNVNSDSLHEKELLSGLNDLKERIKDAKDDSEVKDAMIAGILRITFQLIGELPNRTADFNLPFSGIKNRKEYWKLNSFRTVTYDQNYLQQKVVIFQEVKKGINGFNMSPSDLRRQFSKLKSEKKFINWFKSEYPETYTSIF